MNLLFKFNFPDTVIYRAGERVVYNSKQWASGAYPISKLKYAIGDQREFEVPNIKVTVPRDSKQEEILQGTQDKYILGSRVEGYEADGTQLVDMVIDDYELFSDRVEYLLSNKYGEIISDITEKITEKEFPNAVSTAYGQVIPFSFGQVDSCSTGTVKAYRVDTNTYLVQADDLDTATLSGAWTPTGGTASGATIGASGGRYYITYTGTAVEYLMANITVGSYKAGSPQAVIVALIQRKFKDFCRGNIETDSALDTYLSYFGYTAQFKYYTVSQSKTGKQVLKEFCDSFNIDWTVSNGRIKFKWIDIIDLTATKGLQSSQILSFKVKPVKKNSFANRFFVNGHFDSATNSYLKMIPFDKVDSQGYYGTREKTIYAPFLKTDENIHSLGKYTSLFFKHPKKEAFVMVHYNTFKGLEVGDTLEFSHSKAEDSSTRYYQIRRAEIDAKSNGVLLTLQDFTYLKDVDTNFKLLIQSDEGQNSQSFYDMAIGSDKILSPALSILHDTTYPLYGKSSIKAWGYRRITTPDHADWDIYNDLGEDWTIQAVLYPTDWSNTYTTAQPILEHYADSNNRWSLRFQPNGTSGSTGVLQSFLNSGGSVVSGTNLLGTAVNPTGAHVIITWVRIGSETALYINGIQDAYGSGLASPYNISGTLYIFGTHPMSHYLQAHVSEAFIYKGNLFGASPNSGLTDDISDKLFYHPVTDEGKKITLSVFNPRAGEVWEKGESYLIKWTVPGCRMKVELYDDTGTSKISDISTLVVNDTWYYWDIPAGTTPDDYKIKVSDIDGNISAFSEVFTIE